MNLGSVFDKIHAESTSKRCANCGKPVTQGSSRGYHASECYCSNCDKYFCSGCSMARGDSLCLSCGSRGQRL